MSKGELNAEPAKWLCGAALLVVAMICSTCYGCAIHGNDKPSLVRIIGLDTKLAKDGWGNLTEHPYHYTIIEFLEDGRIHYEGERKVISDHRGEVGDIFRYDD